MDSSPAVTLLVAAHEVPACTSYSISAQPLPRTRCISIQNYRSMTMQKCCWPGLAWPGCRWAGHHCTGKETPSETETVFYLFFPFIKFR